MLRVVLVDDERCVLEELEFLLQGKVEIAGKFSNSITAVENIADLAPDAVFLDVEMPGLSGLEAATEILNILPKVAVLFVTSYGHYAVDAFELNAVDYLVKPVQPDRLNKALDRIKRRLSEGRREELKQLLHNTLAINRRPTVNLWNGRQLQVIPVEKVACCFVAKGARKVSVVADGQVYRSSGTLFDFVKKAGLCQLLRCNRSYYINPSFIIKLEPGQAENLAAYIQGFGEGIPVSRKYRPEILKVLEEGNKS